ncbi:MAG TPA: M3 family metallopeptidase, partial [Novosphingobium sp.]|nr:M3 family metallopeptidase [Novosphingobium sp.]
HWQTGAAMPAAMAAKLKELRRVDQAYELGEVVAAALLDMAWHSQQAGSAPTDVAAFERQALAASGLDVAHVPPRYRSSLFRHIWSNDYAAGYYAYLWTEMLAHDAFAWFEAHGGLTRANGQRFADCVLSRGHSADYGAMFRAFAGHDPDVAPMLAARGLK